MEIKTLSQLKLVYDAILDFFIDTGYGEMDYGQHPALANFINSYNKLDSLILYWKENFSDWRQTLLTDN